MHMRVLLVDTTQYQPSSPLFLEACRDLAAVSPDFVFWFLDEARFLSSAGVGMLNRVAQVLHRAPPGVGQLNRALVRTAAEVHPDIVLVVKGAQIEPDTLIAVREQTGATLVNFATDDPFNPAVSTSWLVRSIPLYDVYACSKRAIMPDVRAAGAPQVVYLPFGYKESVHFPERPATPEEVRRFSSDAVFIGGADHDRVPYFEVLLRRLPNLRLHLYGGYWDHYPALRRYYRGFARGRAFRLALGGAAIALNLVRRANRDGHVMRTFEIPACGAFMLAERTDEHLELFAADHEAAYFSTPDEMVEQVRYYLAHEESRARIAARGHERAVRGGNTYADRMKAILEAARAVPTRSRAAEESL